MKKLLLILTLTFYGLLGYSQVGCTPDAMLTGAGVYPDSITGLNSAFVGQDYSQNITLITPSDTIVTIGIFDLNMIIDSVSLTSVIGLPYGFSYACDPPNCVFEGGTVKCAELYSTIAPHDSLIGIHNITFSTTTYAYNTTVGQIPQNDVIDYYSIDISAATSVINKFNNANFELKGVYPNPAIDHARIQFVAGGSKDIIFKIYNLLGEEINSQLVSANRGVNTINLNTSLYSEGIYLYSLNDGNQVLTKRMVVKN